MLKKVVSMILCLLVFIVNIIPNIAYADEIMGDKRSNISKEVDDLMGYAAFMYDCNDVDEVMNMQICDLFVSKESISFESNGCVEYVDVIGTLEDGTFINLSRQVEVKVENESVVSWDRGRLFANEAGVSLITVYYGNYSTEIKIEVEKFVDWEIFLKNTETAMKKKKSNQRSVPGPDYSLVMTRAGNMAFVSWTPTQRFRLNDGTYAPANVARKGVPYSLKSEQYDDQAFLTKMSAADFYKENERIKIVNNKAISVYDAQYGLDCSGFVSFAYGTPRCTTWTYRSAIEAGGNEFYEKVGSYTYVNGSYNVNELKTAYTYLNVCDSMVNAHHVRLVVHNNVSQEKVTCIEAGGNSPYIATYTYNTLASEGYLPFTITESYFSSLGKNN